MFAEATFGARRYRYWFTESTYADSTAGDYLAGEDPVIRELSVQALGKLNGSVVVVDANNGRVLSMVNQKLALSAGYMPCSTIKLAAGLAALDEGIVAPKEKVWFQGEWFMTMVNGLAISNNVYFEHLGEELGFDCIQTYARMLGLGEKAGWKIPGEQVGVFPSEKHKAGAGRMTTFGDGISVTPLQLAALGAAIANGGDLYYLQYLQTRSQMRAFQPRLRRRLAMEEWLPEIRRGMSEAVKRGTARKARVKGQAIWGKTGTCTQIHRRKRTQLGWFVSFNEYQGQRLAIVVLLRGGPMMTGPRAAEIAGTVYRGLMEQDYFSGMPQPQLASASPAADTLSLD